MIALPPDALVFGIPTCSHLARELVGVLYLRVVAPSNGGAPITVTVNGRAEVWFLLPGKFCHTCAEAVVVEKHAPPAAAMEKLFAQYGLPPGTVAKWRLVWQTPAHAAARFGPAPVAEWPPSSFINRRPRG